MSAEPLSFLKVEGLGNDFLLVDLRQAERNAAASRGLQGIPGPVADSLATLTRRAPLLCDRHRGVGGDGILVITASTTPGSAGTMIVINHDGSRPEMCGNGLRCVALHLAGRAGPVQVDTDAGPRICTVHARSDDGRSGDVEVDMGPARFLGEHVLAGHHFLAVSLGNPHAVAFVGPDVDLEPLTRSLGPDVERDPRFPDRTNVEFARVEPDGSITLWVWERGCGITAACGTGACATAAAAVRRGLLLADAAVRVQLPGGSLQVRLAGDRVWMTGPARQVFRGELP